MNLLLALLAPLLLSAAADDVCYTKSDLANKECRDVTSFKQHTAAVTLGSSRAKPTMPEAPTTPVTKLATQKTSEAAEGISMQGLSKLITTHKSVVGIASTLFIIMLVTLLVLFFVGKYLVGAAVEASIEELTPAILGCKSTFDMVHVDILQGRVHINNMTIHNPESETPFTAESVFHVDEIIVDLQMTKLFTSFLKTVEVEELVFNGAVASYDKPSMLHNSNIAIVIDNIHAFIKTMKEDLEACEEDTGVDTEQQKPLLKKKPEAKGTKASFIVHKVQVEKLQANIGVEGMSKLISIADFKNDDLAKDCNGTTIEDVVVAFAHQFAESVVKECL